MTFPATLPTPRTPDPLDAPALRWGILGTGWIAERFTDALRRSTRQSVMAVGSRSAASASEFASAHGIERAHGSYDALVGDPDVDVVYVATPHPFHLSGALLALEAGKHVLVEKPFALSAAEGERIAAAAAAHNVFSMEALWTLFLPKFDVIRQLLEDGSLGELRSVLAEYGEHFDPPHRILRADLAGGPLLDLGTYPVAISTWVLGEPAQIWAVAQPHPAGVHGQLSAGLVARDGNQAVVHTTLFSATPGSIVIAGTEATISLPHMAYQPGEVALLSSDGQRRVSWDEERTGHGALHFQAAHVARCIAEGRTESALRPLADTLVTLRTMDEIRRHAGIVFPGEPGF